MAEPSPVKAKTARARRNNGGNSSNSRAKRNNPGTVREDGGKLAPGETATSQVKKRLSSARSEVDACTDRLTRVLDDVSRLAKYVLEFNDCVRSACLVNVKTARAYYEGCPCGSGGDADAVGRAVEDMAAARIEASKEELKETLRTLQKKIAGIESVQKKLGNKIAGLYATMDGLGYEVERYKHRLLVEANKVQRCNLQYTEGVVLVTNPFERAWAENQARDA